MAEPKVLSLSACSGSLMELGNSVLTALGSMTGTRILSVGFVGFPEPLGDCSSSKLGSAINGTPGVNSASAGARDIDDVPGLLLLKDRKRYGDSVKNPLDIDVNGLLPFRNAHVHTILTYKSNRANWAPLAGEVRELIQEKVCLNYSMKKTFQPPDQYAWAIGE